ncbi:hypothetical protein EC844_105139 [Acinetobacter calcoaceticus]|uniref:DUF4488 domain-containing protein n=1 Tax=Acinetobacter calcoaceticus TaxID=471 RepID=A0A4R1Y0Y6_ACICA|nr:hypothetical protein EC844_105139 [Acinetobacter calcoaceticus]
MRKFLSMILTLSFATISNAYDQYIGYWQLENSRNIMEIYKNNEGTYLINKSVEMSIAAPDVESKHYKLEKMDNNVLGVEDTLTTIPLILSHNGSTLRIKNQKLFKISKKSAKPIIENTVACFNLRIEYLEKIGDLQISTFLKNIKGNNEKKIEDIKAKYIKLQNKVPDCNIYPEFY